MTALRRRMIEDMRLRNPLALHPPHRHLQPTAGVGERPKRQLPLEGLRPRQSPTHHDIGRKRVPAPLPDARRSQRLHAHPPLRPLGQPRASEEPDHLPTTAAARAAARVRRCRSSNAILSDLRRRTADQRTASGATAARRDHPSSGQLLMSAASRNFASTPTARRADQSIRAPSGKNAALNLPIGVIRQRLSPPHHPRRSPQPLVHRSTSPRQLNDPPIQSP